MRGSVFFFAVLSLARVASAEPERDPVAIRLFDEGKALIAAGKPESACEKFEAAHARVTWLGIELNLADCYERIGKTASAWGLFRRAADHADREGDPRAAFARDRVAALAPKLSHVKITARELEIRLDGKLLAPAELGESLPLDPGPHEISASLTGRVRWSRRIEVSHAATETVEVPVLELPRPSVTRRADRDEPRIPQSVMVAGSLGFASLAGSIWFGIDASRHLERARDGHCDADLHCDRAGYDDVHAARWRGNLSTALGASTVIAIGVGAVLYVRHRREIVIAPSGSPGAGGVVVRGHL